MNSSSVFKALVAAIASALLALVVAVAEVIAGGTWQTIAATSIAAIVALAAAFFINQARGGRDNDPRFGTRMRGTGAYAELLASRFKLAARKLYPPGPRRAPSGARTGDRHR